MYFPSGTITMVGKLKNSPNEILHIFPQFFSATDNWFGSGIEKFQSHLEWREF